VSNEQAIVATCAVVQGATSIAILLWRGGRWSRGVETGQRRLPSVTGYDTRETPPSMIDLARRVEALERQRESYQRADIAKIENRNVWQAINELRHSDAALTRRIDSLMGQGS